MGPHAFIKESVLVNEAGFVDVDAGTMRHNTYPNAWSARDAANLPTFKTAAAITCFGGESPVIYELGVVEINL